MTIRYIRKKQSGLTLLEILFVIAIMGSIAVTGVRMSTIKLDNAVVESAKSRVHRVQRAALGFYIKNGVWPATMSELVNNNFLTVNEIVDPWGNNFAINIIGDDMVISIDTQDRNLAAKMAPLLPRGTVSGNVVTTRIDPPGSEIVHDALYSLDGSRALTGTMDADGNNISNVGNLTVGGNISAGRVTADRIDALDRMDTDHLQANTIGSNDVISNNIEARSSVTAQIFRDSNNVNYYVNPSSTSRMSTLYVNNYITAYGLRDRDQPSSYYMRPGGNSNISSLYIARDLRVSAKRVGDSCLSGTISVDSAGDILTCKGSRLNKVSSSFTVSLDRNYSNLNNGEYNLGYHHFCSFSGHSQRSSGDRLTSQIRGVKNLDSTGRQHWIYDRDHEKWEQIDRITCFRIES